MVRMPFRRFTGGLLALAVFFSAVGNSFAEGFPDTFGTDYDRAFGYLRQQGIINGYADGTGRPGFVLNRAEALKVILKASGSHDKRLTHYTKKLPPLPLFSDVSQSQWYAPFVETAFEAGIITGYPDGSFRPSQLLRTEEAIAMLMRTFGVEGSKTKAELSNYIENQPNQWYTGSINAAISKNLVMHRGKLVLGATITRGQFFDIVYRLHSVREDKTFAYSGPEPVVAQTRVAAPIARTVPTQQYYGGGDTGVTVSNGITPQYVTTTSTNNVPVAPRINHPYASEKYFSISMPSIGITDLTITHPYDASKTENVLDILQLGVGHLFAYPGAGGKIMVYGHSSGYPWDVSEYTKIFRKINELKQGDKVYVTYSGNLYVYEVTHENTIAAKDADAAFQDNGAGEELILFTCWPPDSIAQRYLVHAIPVETVALR